MTITIRKPIYWIMGLVLIAALAATGAVLASGAGASNGASGQIDDGAELLDQASISLEEAIAAAQGAAEGEVGEIDLEKYQRRLVFNVDIGSFDVKVDAENGAVLGQEADDEHDKDDNDD